MRKSLSGLVAAGVALSLSAPGVPAHAAIYTWTKQTLPSSSGLSEPGIDVDPTPGSKKIYVNAIAGLGSVSPIWRSSDDGVNWLPTIGTLRAPCIGGGDADMVVHPGGRISFTDLWLGSAGVCRTDDIAGGLDWKGQPFSVPVMDRQWLAAAGDITYFVTHQLPAGLVVAKSYDGGVTYPDMMLAARPDEQGNCICPPGNLIAEQGPNLGLPPAVPDTGVDDKVGVIYSVFDTDPFVGSLQGGVAFNRSLDGGKTWGRNLIYTAAAGADTTKSFPVVANSGNGVLHAVWVEYKAGADTSEIWYARSSNWGDTWTASAAAAIVTGGSSIFPWIDASPTKVALAYYHNTDNDVPDDTTGTWDVMYKQSTLSGGVWSAFSSAETVDTDVKSGAVCTAGLNCNANRELGDFLQVALRQDGTPIISYVDAEGTSAIKVASGA